MFYSYFILSLFEFIYISGLALADLRCVTASTVVPRDPLNFKYKHDPSISLPDLKKEETEVQKMMRRQKGDET